MIPGDPPLQVFVSCQLYADSYQVFTAVSVEVLCAEEKLCSLLPGIRVTTRHGVAKIPFGYLYPKHPNSNSPVYSLALHSLVIKGCNYYNLTPSPRELFFAPRSYSEILILVFFPPVNSFIL